MLVPALAVTVVVFVLLGPARLRGAVAARVLASSPNDRVVRVLLLERGGLGDRGVEGSFELYAADEVAPRCTGTTRSDGVAECDLAEPLPPSTEVRVERSGSVIARGSWPAETAASPALARAVVGRAKADGLSLEVSLERGLAVPPFPERLDATVKQADGSGAPATVRFELSSAEPAEGVSRADSEGSTRLEWTPLANPATATVEAKLGDRTVVAEATMPVELGGLYVSPASSEGRVEVTSSSPRSVAYLSILGPEGRIAGQRVPLTPDDHGFFRGYSEGTLPPEAIGIVASSDPSERSRTLWPAPGRSGRLEASTLGVLVDGMPTALSTERRRARWVRFGVVGLVSTAAALELGLLLWARRRTRKELEDLDEALSEGEVRADGSVRQAHPLAEFALLAAVVLAFGTVAALLLR